MDVKPDETVFQFDFDAVFTADFPGRQVLRALKSGAKIRIATVHHDGRDIECLAVEMEVPQ